MSLSIQSITPHFAAEASGVDLRSKLTSAEVAAIEAGMDRYAVLVFLDQRIDDDEQLAFTRNFGEMRRRRAATLRRTTSIGCGMA